MTSFTDQVAIKIFSYCFLQDGASPLWIACQMGHLAIVQELLRAGAEVDAPREVNFLTLISARVRKL